MKLIALTLSKHRIILQSGITLITTLLLSTMSFGQCIDDTDCDGILNLVDVDDDNDGILDIEELLSCIDLSDLSQSQIILYNEDFGSGAVNPGPAIPSLIDGSYCYENLTGTCTNNSIWVADVDIDDNEYSILNNPVFGFAEAFRSQNDHTVGDVSGYQLCVNASDNPGIMFHKDNIAIPSGSFPTQTVVFTVWLSNIGSELNQQTCADCCGGAIRPNVDFILQNATTGLEIGLPISSGDIEPSQNGDDAWVVYTSVFDVTGVSAVNIVIRNNQIGGCGNDVAIDDISLGLIDIMCDFDNDGIADYLDLDSDNDGIFDVVEGGDGDLDTNNDGVIDSNDTGFLDADGNGASDVAETTTPPDTDGDGAINSLDLDSDGDGCFDTTEAGHEDSDDDGILGTSPAVEDWDGTVLAQNGYTGTTNDVTTPGSFGTVSVTYSQAVYEQYANNDIPVLVGSTGGEYTSEVGLTIDAQTGEINPSTSIPGIYNVNYSTGMPCQSDASFILEILNDPIEPPVVEPKVPFSIYIPNVISLSSSVGNDLWFITYEGIAEYNCAILNRWGNLIFESDNPDDKWNGNTLSDERVTDGVYFYIIKGLSIHGDKIDKHGHITVVQ